MPVRKNNSLLLAGLMNIAILPMPLRITVLLVLLLLGWDAGGLDLPLARWFGDQRGFAWRDHWLLTSVMHEGGRSLSWLLVLALGAGVRWPWGPLRRLPRAVRLQLALTPLLAALMISMLKGVNATSCPWDLAEFGGPATYLPHWLGFLRGDGGGGHCFPAGHASSGFAFIGGYVVCRQVDPRQARLWLLGGLLAGLLLGLGQQLRGAHFMSHTLWSGMLCWLAAWGIEALRLRWWPRGAAAGPASAGQ
ncbi:MAG: hypothetical protein RJA44_2394 [Pseudomonadota bacterium]|jgi:membrane-associated PAP2 superfamily phosphatase